MCALLVAAAAAVVVALYLAGIVLLGRCLNLHGEPPRNRTENGSK